MLLAQDTLNIGNEAKRLEIPLTQDYTGATGVAEGFGAYVSTLLSAVMTIAALLVLVFLVWGAIEWITAGGDSGKIQKAREKITQSIIGIIVLASTLALFMLLQKFLGITVINFGGSSSGGSIRRASSGGTVFGVPRSATSTGAGGSGLTGGKSP